MGLPMGNFTDCHTVSGGARMPRQASAASPTQRRTAGQAVSLTQRIAAGRPVSHAHAATMARKAPTMAATVARRAPILWWRQVATIKAQQTATQSIKRLRAPIQSTRWIAARKASAGGKEGEAVAMGSGADCLAILQTSLPSGKPQNHKDC